MINLHAHTNASDGDLTPKELIDQAISAKLDAIAITDHDTIDSLKFATEYSKGKIDFIPGIEISTYEKEYKEVHILGLFVNYDNKELIEFCNRTANLRKNQKIEMIKKLNSLGFEITFEEVEKIVGTSFGRPHLAKILLKKYPNEFKSIQDVFDKYLGLKKPAYVKRTDLTSMKDGIDVIKKAGGLPILAHPGVYHDKDAAELIDNFITQGGVGIETHYPYFKILNISKEESDHKVELFKNISIKKNILESGGTDYHGNSRNVSISEINIPIEILTKLHKHLNKNL